VFRSRCPAETSAQFKVRYPLSLRRHQNLPLSCAAFQRDNRNAPRTTPINTVGSYSQYCVRTLKTHCVKRCIGNGLLVVLSLLQPVWDLLGQLEANKQGSDTNSDIAHLSSIHGRPITQVHLLESLKFCHSRTFLRQQPERRRQVRSTNSHFEITMGPV
jgi:hypothetical protein